mmetsp:Transcript_17970/g.26916  ORF Transcript_17970/g.26916 Transcript_17970/m.26916 type:complete len:291 (+) Transcript_17970:326-1198(+)
MGNQCCKPDEKHKQSGFVIIGNQRRSLSTSSPNSSTILTSGTNSTPIVTNTSSIQTKNSNANGILPPNSGAGGLLNGSSGNIQSIKHIQAEEEAAAEREEQQRALQEEQNRLEEIVALAGRDMVPVVVRNGGSMNSLNSIGGYTGGSGGSGGGGGSNVHAISLGGYYDPGYANLIMQDLSHALMEYNQSLNNEKQGAGSTAGGVGVNDNNNSDDVKHADYRSIPETSVIDGRDAIDVLCNNSTSRRRIEKDYDLDLEDMAETFLTSVFCTKGGLVKDIGPIVENVFSAGD